MRAFVRLREMLATNQRLAGKIQELESRLSSHDSVILNWSKPSRNLRRRQRLRKPHRVSASGRQRETLTGELRLEFGRNLLLTFKAGLPIQKSI